MGGLLRNSLSNRTGNLENHIREIIFDSREFPNWKPYLQRATQARTGSPDITMMGDSASAVLICLNILWNRPASRPSWPISLTPLPIVCGIHSNPTSWRSPLILASRRRNRSCGSNGSRTDWPSRYYSQGSSLPNDGRMRKHQVKNPRRARFISTLSRFSRYSAEA
jgi:hypothetical protein